MRCRTHPRIRVAFVCATLLIAASCSQRFADVSTSRDTTLRVTNRGIDDVRIYVLRDDFPIKIGTVSARSARQFVLSPALISNGNDIRLRAETTSGRNVLISAVFCLQPGNTVGWEVEPTLGITALSLN